MKKRIISLLLSTIMLFSLLPVTAMAGDGIAYIERSWNGNEVAKADRNCTNYSVVSSGSKTWNAGWYVVNANTTISSAITVSGDVHLILCDNVTLTAQKGIVVNGKGNNSLTIYGQSGDSGKLITTGSSSAPYGAGIGGGGGYGDNYKSGTITIHGGTIQATGGNYTAGIGDVQGSGGGAVTIYGGTVKAIGQDLNGAGIGCDTVRIYGGTVNATGYAGGIRGNVTVNGGMVTAKSDGGTFNNGIGGSALTVDGGTVTATGYYNGAGIGSSAVIVNAGKVTATGGEDGPGISGSTLTVNGGEVSATGKDLGAGIVSSVSVNGGKITADGGDYATFEGVPAGISGTVSFGENFSGGVLAGASAGEAVYMTKADYCADHSANYVTMPVEMRKVAAIVETEEFYDSVQAAILAAQDGQTVKMLLDSRENLTIAQGKNITLDLNGKVLTDRSGGSVIAVNGTLTLIDSDPTAMHDDASLPAGGIITGGSVTAPGSIDTTGGGGVLVNGSFTMTGGTITGNSAEYGGGVFVSNRASFTMTDGAITGNSADCGGGVYVSNEACFTMTGGTITENCGGVYVYDNFEHNVIVGGTAKIFGNRDGSGSTNNLYFTKWSGIRIETDEDAPAQGMLIGVTTADEPDEETPVTFAEYVEPTDAKYFFADNEAYAVAYDYDEDISKGCLQLVVPQAEDYYPVRIGGTKISRFNKDDVLHDGGSVSFDPDTNTLTLNNTAIATDAESSVREAIKSELPAGKTLTVKLIGTNVIGRAPDEEYEEYTVNTGLFIGKGMTKAAAADGSLLLIGDKDSSLTIYASGDGISSGDTSFGEDGKDGKKFEGELKIYSDHNAIESQKSVFANGGKIFMESQNLGIRTKGDVTVSGGELTIRAENRGISASGAVTISGGKLDVTGGEDNCAIFADGGFSITSTDCQIIARGSDPDYGAIYSGSAPSFAAGLTMLGSTAVDATIENITDTAQMVASEEEYDYGVFIGTEPAKAVTFKLVRQHTTHDGIEFQPWVPADHEGALLPNVAGSWYLTDNVTVNTDWNVPEGTTNLCLNGKVLNLNRYRIDIPENATLNLFDCGEVEHEGNINSYHLWSLGEGEEGSTPKNIKGGIIYIPGDTTNFRVYGTFNMFGGTITGHDGSTGYYSILFNQALFDSNTQPLSRAGNFNMYGGAITGNVYASNMYWMNKNMNFGFINPDKFENFTVGKDAVIDGNYILGPEAGGVYKVEAGNVIVSGSKVVQIATGDYAPTDKMHIGVRSVTAPVLGTPVVFTGANAGENDASRFESNMANICIERKNNDALYLCYIPTVEEVIDMLKGKYFVNEEEKYLLAPYVDDDSNEFCANAVNAYTSGDAFTQKYALDILSVVECQDGYDIGLQKGDGNPFICLKFDGDKIVKVGLHNDEDGVLVEFLPASSNKTSAQLLSELAGKKYIAEMEDDGETYVFSAEGNQTGTSLNVSLGIPGFEVNEFPIVIELSDGTIWCSYPYTVENFKLDVIFVFNYENDKITSVSFLGCTLEPECVELELSYHAKTLLKKAIEWTGETLEDAISAVSYYLAYPSRYDYLLDEDYYEHLSSDTISDADIINVNALFYVAFLNTDFCLNGFAAVQNAGFDQLKGTINELPPVAYELLDLFDAVAAEDYANVVILASQVGEDGFEFYKKVLKEDPVDEPEEVTVAEFMTALKTYLTDPSVSGDLFNNTKKASEQYAAYIAELCGVTDSESLSKFRQYADDWAEDEGNRYMLNYYGNLLSEGEFSALPENEKQDYIHRTLVGTCLSFFDTFMENHFAKIGEHFSANCSEELLWGDEATFVSLMRYMLDQMVAHKESMINLIDALQEPDADEKYYLVYEYIGEIVNALPLKDQYDPESKILYTDWDNLYLAMQGEDVVTSAFEVEDTDNGRVIKLLKDINCAELGIHGEALSVEEGKSIVLDLNGHKLDRNLKAATEKGSVIIIEENASLTLIDSSDEKDGKITGGNATNGGGVYVVGTFNMYGGTITNNTVSQYGGGVYVAEKAIITVGGTAKIIGNTANEVANNVYLPTGKTITLGTDENIPTEDMSVGITLASGTGNFATGVTTPDYLTYFTSDDNRYCVKATGNKVGPHTYTYSIAEFDISVETLTNGSITVDQSAYNGETVTITVTPATGYKLTADSLKATYNDGTQQTLELTQDTQDLTKYTFTMPGFAVSITAEFVEKITNEITGLTLTGWTYGDEPNSPSATSTYGEINYTYSTKEDGEYVETKPTNAGTYYVKAEVLEGDEYKGAVAKLQFTISPKAITVTIADKASVYGASLVELTSSITSGTLYSGDDLAITLTKAEGANVGTYAITGTYNNANYNVTFENGIYTITAKDITGAEVVYDESKVYNGETQTFEVTSVTIDGLIATVDVTNNTEKDYNENGYTLTITANGNFTGTITKNFAITKKAATITVVAGTKVYGETDPALTATVSGTVGTDKLNYTVKRATGENVGEYALTIELGENPNYEISKVETAKFTITKKAASEPTVTGTYTYTGNEQNATISGKESYMTENGDIKGTNAGTYTITYTLDGNHEWVTGSDGTVTWSIGKANAVITVDKTPITKTFGEAITLPTATSNFGTVTCDKVAADLVNVGTYTVTYTVADTDNYNGTTETVSVTIGKLAVSEPTVTGTYTYTGNEQNATISGKESYMTENGDIKGTNAGTYTITYTLDGNHEWATGSDGTVTWSIGKATQIITANAEQNFVFGDTDKAVIASALDNAVLSYAVKIGDSVTVDASSGALTISKIGDTVITITAAETDNYNSASCDITIKIGAKAITKPTAVSKTYTYDGTEQTFELTGFDANTMTISGNTQTNANESGYTVTVTPKANYAWNTDGDCTFTWKIAKADMVVGTNILAPSVPVSELVYDGSAKELLCAGQTWDEKDGTTAFGTFYYSVDGKVWSTDLPTAINAGEYNPVWYFVGDENHNNIGSAEAPISQFYPIEITKGDQPVATVVMDGYTYGGTLSDPSISIIPAENATVTYYYSATNTTAGGTEWKNMTAATLDAGIYYIYAVIGVTDNYEEKTTEAVSFIVAKQAVEAPEILSKVYTGNTLTADVSASTLYTVTTNNGGTTVGSYNVVLVLNDPDNYKWSDSDEATKTLSFTITKADNAWTTEPKIDGVTYGTPISPVGAAKFGSVTITYVGTGDTVYNSTEAPTNAGTYKATFSITATDDYGALTKNVEFTIAKKSATVTVDAKTKVYGETDPALTATVSGTVGTDKLNYTVKRATGENVGEYALSIEFGENPNYEISKVETAKFIITKKAVEKPSADTTSFVYTGNDQTYTLAANDLYTVSGNVQKNAGTYNVTVALKDKANYKWADGGNDDLTYTFTIAKATGTITVDTTTITKTYGETVTLPTAKSNLGTVICDKTAADLVNADTYTVTYTLAGTTNYSGATKTLTVVINQKTVEKPTADMTSFVYTGKDQTYTIAANDLYTVSGNVQKNAGTYNVTVALKDKSNYKWADGNSDDLTYTFTIAKAQNAIHDLTIGNWKDTENSKAPTATADFGSDTIEYAFSKSDVRNFVFELPTEAGEYIVKAFILGTDNYGAAEAETTFTIYESQKSGGDSGENEKPAVKMETESGFDPNLILEVEVVVKADEIVAENHEAIVEYKELTEKFEKIAGVYDVRLLLNGTEIQPEDLGKGTVVTVRMLVPEHLIGKEFRILHVHSEADIQPIVPGEEAGVGTYIIDDEGYLVTKIDRLSEFVFTYQPDCAVHWVLIAILALFVVTFVIFTLVMKKKLLAFIACGVCGVATIVLAFFAGCVICTVFTVINLVVIAAGALYTLFFAKEDDTVKAPQE